MSSVRFGGSDASSFTVDSPTQITATVPAHATGPVGIQVTAAGGTSLDSRPGCYTYVSAAVEIVSVVYRATPPTSEYVELRMLVPGSLRGYSVRDTSTHFYTFPDRVFQAGDTLRLYTGPGSDSQTELFWGRNQAVWNDDFDTVTVLDPENQLIATHSYAEPPTIGSLSPRFGATGGGDSVVVRGSNFVGVTAVRFGTSDATSLTVDSATQITATPPAQAAGEVHVRVTALGGTNASDYAGARYTYVDAPTITGLSSSMGPAAGGQSVVITGTGFVEVSALRFGTVEAASFTVESDTQIRAVTPACAAGAVDVLVTALGGTSVPGAVGTYAFFEPAAISTLDVGSGSMGGGNPVVIGGCNFVGVTAVRFGAVDAGSFTVDSSSQITAIAPAHSAGPVHVQVVAAGGTSINDAGDEYGYVASALAIVSVVYNATPATSEYVEFRVLESGSLQGYSVRDESGLTYGFPNRVFRTGDAFRLYTGTGADSQTELFWGRGSGVWNNDHDTVFVSDPQGQLLTSYPYSEPPSVTSLSPASSSTAGENSVVIRGSRALVAASIVATAWLS